MKNYLVVNILFMLVMFLITEDKSNLVISYTVFGVISLALYFVLNKVTNLDNVENFKGVMKDFDVTKNINNTKKQFKDFSTKVEGGFNYKHSKQDENVIEVDFTKKKKERFFKR